MTDLDLLLKVAFGELGVSEVAGSASNPRIQEYYAASGIASDDPAELGGDDSTTAWCGCYLAWVVSQLGYAPPDKSFRAREWLNFGAPVGVPRPGAIAVLQRPPNPSHGHCAIYLERTPDGRSVALLGGNQGNAVSVRLYDWSLVLGWRVPTLGGVHGFDRPG